MTKTEAIAAMERGEKVTHRFFTDDEWMTMQDGEIIFEDGVHCSPEEFWRNKTSPGWQDDYKIEY